MGEQAVFRIEGVRKAFGPVPVLQGVDLDLKAGAVTVLITDLSAAASANASTHVLRCRCHSPSPFNTFSAAVTLINDLAWSVTERLGEASHARFETIDRLVKLMDDVSLPREDKR